MHSTTERPLEFFFYFLTNYIDYIAVNFYEEYQRNLMVSDIDRDNGIIYHTYQDDNSDYIQYKEFLNDFIVKKIHFEIEKSKKLIDDNFRKLVAQNSLYAEYLKLAEKDLKRLFKLSSNFKAFDLSTNVVYLMKYFEDCFRSNISFTKAYIAILRDLELIDAPKNKIILSFQWNKLNHPTQQYIAVIGNCGNNILSLENFYLANRRVGGGVLNVVKRKFCVDVISVTIGDYITYLGENNSSNKYTITYRWKAPNGTYTGNGEMGLMKNCVRHIYNNRKEPKQKKITFLSVACKAF